MADPVYGFKDRETAERLKVLAREPIDLTSARRGGASLPPSRPSRLRYKSMSEDHLVCRTWDGTTEGSEDVKVAKPYLLRRTTTRTGYTYVYTTDYERESTKTSDSSTEDQVIVPAYTENDEIWAAKADTGVTVGGQDVTYIDLNLDARAWAKA